MYEYIHNGVYFSFWRLKINHMTGFQCVFILELRVVTNSYITANECWRLCRQHIEYCTVHIQYLILSNVGYWTAGATSLISQFLSESGFLLQSIRTTCRLSCGDLSIYHLALGPIYLAVSWIAAEAEFSRQIIPDFLPEIFGIYGQFEAWRSLCYCHSGSPIRNEIHIVLYCT